MKLLTTFLRWCRGANRSDNGHSFGCAQAAGIEQGNLNIQQGQAPAQALSGHGPHNDKIIAAHTPLSGEAFFDQAVKNGGSVTTFSAIDREIHRINAVREKDPKQAD